MNKTINKNMKEYHEKRPRYSDNRPSHRDERDSKDVGVHSPFLLKSQARYVYERLFYSFE